MKTGFFEEAPGQKSSTRLKTFVLMIFLMGFDVMLSRTSGFTIDYNFILFNFLILLAIFTPQYLHKIVEQKGFLKEEDKE